MVHAELQATRSDEIHSHEPHQVKEKCLCIVERILSLWVEHWPRLPVRLYNSINASVKRLNGGSTPLDSVLAWWSFAAFTLRLKKPP